MCLFGGFLVLDGTEVRTVRRRGEVEGSFFPPRGERDPHGSKPVVGGCESASGGRLRNPSSVLIGPNEEVRLVVESPFSEFCHHDGSARAGGIAEVLKRSRDSTISATKDYPRDFGHCKSDITQII